MISERIRTIAKEYRWVIIASVFFIAWKFFLIGVMWEGRDIPPEPDDSYEYVAHIASVSECQSGLQCRYTGVSMTDHSGFSYLSYRMILGSIGKITGLSPEDTFHVGFYIGTILLLLVFVPFLQLFTKDKKIIAWSILFLAFYHGTGESHGFFWVVPSFMSVLLFFSLFVLITKKTTSNCLIGGIIAIIYTFSHPMSTYIIFILPIYLVLLYVISKKLEIPVIKRAAFILLVVITSSFVQAKYLASIHQTDYYGLKQSLMQAKVDFNQIAAKPDDGDRNEERVLGYSITKTTNDDLLGQRIATLDAAYFRFIIPHWSAVIPFVLVILLLFIKRNTELLTLYLSSLFFFVAATVLHEFGFRSAIILWPLTFIIYAFGSWHLLCYAKKITRPFPRRISIVAVTIGVIFFLIINASLAVAYNSNLNARHKYAIDESFAGYLLENMHGADKFSMSGILARTQQGASLYLSSRNAPASAYPKYLVIIDESQLPIRQKSSLSTIENIAFSIANKLISVPIANTATNRNIPTIPVGYSLDKEFGVIKIFRKNN